MQESPPVVVRHHLRVVGTEGPRTDAIALDGKHHGGTFVVHEVPWPPRVAAPCPCRFANMRGHHDRLVRAATDVAMTVDLLELAVTWNELDYSREPLIPPADWLDFVGQHRWPDVTMAERLFTAAADVALRRPPAVATADPPAGGSGAIRHGSVV